MSNAIFRLPGLVFWIVAGLGTAAPAAVLDPLHWIGSQDLPDNDASGLAFNFTVDDPADLLIGVSVSLDIVGGYNGDLYLYLSRGSEFAVLLNRVGTANGDDYGYATPGFSVTLTSGAGEDIHRYQEFAPTYNGDGQVTGTWAADGRDLDPNASGEEFEAAPRSATLDVFLGTSAAGNWTLFLADVSPGQVSTLRGVAVQFTTVPEPAAGATVVVLALAGYVAYSRVRRPRR